MGEYGRIIPSVAAYIGDMLHWLPVAQHISYRIAMFPLSCARVRASTGREMSAHKKTWSARKFSFKNVF